MNTIIVLKNAMEIKKEITRLGHFVNRYINGNFENEYDLKNPCGFDFVISSNLFPMASEFKNAVFYEKGVHIIMINGDIVKITASTRQYYIQEQIENIVNKLAGLGQLYFQEVTVWNGKKEIICREDINLEKALENINSSFYHNKTKIMTKDFVVNINEIIFNERNGMDGRLQYKRVFVQTFTKKIFIEHNIIQSNKFKIHMNAHKNDFIIPYENIVSYALANNYFSNLNGNFVEVVIEFPFKIGYSNLCKTTETEEVVYAKRKNREIHSRFTLDGQVKLTNKCAMVLSREKGDNSNTYYLITMFPGEYLVKEPQDRNIKSEKEKLKSIEFWNTHALAFKPKDVDLLTISYDCPYSATI